MHWRDDGDTLRAYKQERSESSTDFGCAAGGAARHARGAALLDQPARHDPCLPSSSRDVGDDLLIRSGRHYERTTRGERLLKELEALLPRLEAMLRGRSFDPFRSHDRFRVIAFAVTTSVQATPLAPIQEPDNMITQVVAGCGMGMTRVNGVCVSRHAKRVARRCARWNGSTCAKYY